jgi:hypothetical protein
MSVEEKLTEALGFKVEDGQVKTRETRKDSFDQKVPMGVRPATEQEKALWSLLVIYRNVIDAGSND